MNHLVAFIALVVSAAEAESVPKLPIHSGLYTFTHRFFEHPSIPSVSLSAEINGTHIVLTNKTRSDVFPMGVVAEGMFMWYPASKQWIIGDDESDAQAEVVGGCSDGPEVVDLVSLTYWTC